MAIKETVEVIVSARDEASGVLKGIGGSLGGIGKAALGLAAGGAVAGLAGLGAGLKIAIDEGLEAQEVEAQLGAVLKSTGGIAGITAEMATDLAGSLMGVSTYSDDAILSGENMLLTFTNIGKDIFPDATQTMLDMSTAMGQDIKSSAIQLGKALNDPILGVSALARVGVNFTEEQKAMIKGLVESGDAMTAQKMILKELQTEFGGSAEAAGSTFSGQLEILKNNLLNVAESAGTSLIPILTTGLQSIAPVITDLAGRLSDFLQSEGFRDFLAGVADFISTKLAPALLKLIDFLGTILPPIFQALGVVWDNVVAPIFEWLIDILEKYVFPALATLGKWLGENIPKFLNTLKVAWEKDFGFIRTIFETVWNNLKDWISALKALFSGDFEEFGKIVRGIFDRTMKAIGDILSSVWETVKNIDWIELGKNIVVGIVNGIVNFTEWVINAIIDLGGAVLKAIKGFLGITSPSKVMADQVGKPMAEGLALGFTQNLPDLAGALSGVTSGGLSLGLQGGGINISPPQSKQFIIAPVIEYKPLISLADKRVAETNLKPIINKIIRDYVNKS